MDERQPPPTRNSSRTLAKVAVAVLVVIAIAGIVLASLRGRGTPADTSAAADATPGAASAMTAAAAAASKAAAAATAEAEVGPNQVVFAPGSAEVSEAATTKLQRIADTHRKDKRDLAVTARVGQGPELEQRKALARDRGSAVRSVLETNGVPLGKMQILVTDEALGIVSASEANRVQVTPR